MCYNLDNTKSRKNMADVKVILTGYTNADKKALGQKEETRPTMALIRDHNLKILSDPGVLSDQEILIQALAKEKLKINDITHIFITHSHLDHYRNVGMFKKAKIIEYFGIWDGANVTNRPKKLTKNIEIVETPGHNSNSITMLVDTDYGKVAIVGDLWWSKRGPKVDPYASDLEKLQKSREKIAEIADLIIPGHGDVFFLKQK